MEAKPFFPTFVRTQLFLNLLLILPFALLSIALGSWKAALIIVSVGNVVLASASLRAAVIVRRDAIVIAYGDAATIPETLDRVLPSIGYKLLESVDAVGSPRDRTMIARPAGLGVLAPIVRVRIGSTEALIEGPRARVHRLAYLLKESDAPIDGVRLASEPSSSRGK